MDEGVDIMKHLGKVLTLVLSMLAPGLAGAVGPGEAAPAFTLATVPHEGGKSGNLALGDYKGRVLMVDIWAAWCPPCRTSFPLMEELYRQHRDQGFAIAALSQDPKPEQTRTFLNKLPVSFDIAWDEGGGVAREYQARAMPTSFLIDRKGVVRFVHYGFFPSQMPQVAQEVKQLLGETP